MTSPLILHYAPDNASLCVRLALGALNTPFETALVDRRAGGHKRPDYLTLNPNGLIPVLETPDGALYETAAILLWLADHHPGQMFPAPDAPGRGPALTRLFWLANTVHPTLRMLFYPDQHVPEATVATAAEARRRLNGLWDQMAADRTHLAPETPSIIGCYLAPMLRWCALYGGDTSWFDLTRWPTLHNFALTFEQHPFAVDAARQEGLGPTPFSAPSPPNPPEGHAI